MKIRILFMLVVVINFGDSYAQGQPGNQIEVFRSKVVENPQSPQAHYNLGVIYDEAHNPSEAMVEFEKAIQLNPKYKLALIALGNMHEGAEENRYKDKAALAKAILYYERASQVDPSDGFIHHLLISAYWAQGNKKTALYHWYKYKLSSPYQAIIDGIVVLLWIIILCASCLKKHNNTIIKTSLVGALIFSSISLIFPVLQPPQNNSGISTGLSIIAASGLLIWEAFKKRRKPETVTIENQNH